MQDWVFRLGSLRNSTLCRPQNGQHRHSGAKICVQHEVHLLNISSGQSASLARVGGCFSTLLLCSSLPMHKKPGIGSEGKKIHSCNILPRGCEFSQCGQLKPASLPCLVDYTDSQRLEGHLNILLFVVHISWTMKYFYNEIV